MNTATVVFVDYNYDNNKTVLAGGTSSWKKNVFTAEILPKMVRDTYNYY